MILKEQRAGFMVLFSLSFSDVKNSYTLTHVTEFVQIPKVILVLISKKFNRV